MFSKTWSEDGPDRGATAELARCPPDAYSEIEMRAHLLAASLALVAVLTIPASAAAEVELRITGGRVWLKAVNATVGQILNEWSRLGQTEIVNGDRVPGGPVTLQLEDVSEEEALDVLLRSAAGFMGVRRTMSATAASEFDRILILPRSTAAPASAAASVPRPVASPAPVFPPPQLEGEAAPVFNFNNSQGSISPRPRRPSCLAFSGCSDPTVSRCRTIRTMTWRVRRSRQSLRRHRRGRPHRRSASRQEPRLDRQHLACLWVHPFPG